MSNEAGEPHTGSFCMHSESTSGHNSAACSVGLVHTAKLSEWLFHKWTVCNFANTCSAQKGLFWYQIWSFKSQDVSTQTGVDECVCFAYSQRQVEEEHICLHTAGLLILRCVQTIFLFSPPKKADQITQSMLGKWFTQFIYYFTLFYLKNSNEFIFFPWSLPKTKINFETNFQAFKAL